MDLLDLRGMEWMRDAPCTSADPELFCPDKANQVLMLRAARRICSTCPVAGECLAFAVEHHEQGIWGGTDDRQRAQMRRVTA